MKVIKKYAIALTAILAVGQSQAGNPDRSGAAGADYLLINPWARSAGLANSNMASVTGIEASFQNVAGMAFTRKTELAFTHTNYLAGTGIRLNAFGFAQKLGGSGYLGVSVMSMGFGEIPITTVDLPDGGIGTFRPNNSVFAIHYAKEFSNSIYGGISVKVLSESISNVSSQGVAFDAGIRYVTGENDNVRFGIALQNVGPPMRFKGDGLTVTGFVQGTTLTVEQRSEKYELPSLVNIGFAYDFIFSENSVLTGNLQFISNSFSKDQFGFSADYSWNKMVILRAGYLWEDKIGDKEQRSTFLTGPTAGLTVQIPAGQNESRIGIDYSYRATNPFAGIHSIGLHIDL
jgi:hypothetical protein